MRESAGVARMGTPAWRSRDLCSASSLSTALCRLYPPPFAGALPTLRQRSSRATPVFYPALPRRPLPRCAHALRSNTLALDFALRRRSLLRLAKTLHWATWALYAGAGAIHFALQLSPVLRCRSSRHYANTWARQGRLILLAAGLLFGEPRGGAGYGARCRNRTIV